MGYTRHDAVIVTMADYALKPESIGRDDIPAVDLDAFRASLPEDWRRLVVGPVESIVNGYYTAAFLPDGSKEDWDTSDDGIRYRDQFAALFSFTYEDGSTPFDIVRVRFGGDEPGAGYEPELIVDNGRGLRVESAKEGA